MGFPRQEYWSGWPFPSPEDLYDPGIKPRSPALQAVSYIAGILYWLSQQGSPIYMMQHHKYLHDFKLIYLLYIQLKKVSLIFAFLVHFFFLIVWVPFFWLCLQDVTLNIIIDAFELWCWRLLRVSWTARRSNQSILKEISPEYSLEGLMLKLKLQHFGHLLQRTDSLEKNIDAGKDWRQEEKGT